MKILQWFVVSGVAFLLLTAAPVYADEKTDYTKVFIIPFMVSDDGITPGPANLQYGYGPNLGHGQGAFQGEVKGAGGMVILSFPISDPRIGIGDDMMMYPDGTVSAIKGRYEKRPSASMNIIIPFKKESAVFSLRDTTSGHVATVDLTQVTRDFCKAHQNDPDCSSGLPLPLILGGIIVIVLAALAGWYLLKKKPQEK